MNNRVKYHLYYRISDEIFCRIYREIYKKGSVLPSIIKMSKEMGSSPETIRKALYILVENKVLIKSKNAFFVKNDILAIEEYKELYINRYKNVYLEAMKRLE